VDIINTHHISLSVIKKPASKMNNRHDEFRKTGNLLKDNQTRVVRRNKRSFPALRREGMTGER